MDDQRPPVREAYVDPVAAASTPFGGTIAHGFLTLSLASAMSYDAVERLDGVVMGVNYGFDKLRFLAPVPAGSNRWIVGHGIPFRAVAGPPHLAEGEAVVIRPMKTGWTVVARLRVDDWAGLVAAR